MRERHDAPFQPAPMSAVLGPAAADTQALRSLARWARQSARARPGLWVTLGLLGFAAVWLAHLASTSLAPPTDNIEQLTWVHSLEWGYYKHPPLPTWLFWLPAHVFGESTWTSYIVGAACTLASVGLLWRLLSQLRGARYATLALLAVLCITYYNGRLYYYNHNIVLMLFATASATLCWAAFKTGQLRWWAALGVAIGLGALAKYQIAVTIVSVLVFWLWQRGWRDARHRLGLLLAALIALLMFLPHLAWLRSHDFGPIGYAMQTSLGVHLGTRACSADAAHWLVDQLLNRALPAWLLLGAALWVSRRQAVAPAPLALPATHDDAGRALLLSWGLVPLLFMPLLGVATGADLKLHWGTPFLLFAVPAAMELLGARVRWSQVALAPTAKAFVVIQGLLLLVSQLTSPRGPEFLRDHGWRTFDAAALAAKLEPLARKALAGGAICVVSGPAAPAGALALRLADHPLVLIDGRYDRSPWVSRDQVRRCGVLELQQGRPLPGSRSVGAEFAGLFWRVVPPAVGLAGKAPGDRAQDRSVSSR